MLARGTIDLIDPDIGYGLAVSADSSAYSKPEQLVDKIFDKADNYATLEWHRWGLDGSFNIYPDDPADLIGEQGFQGQALSEDDCTFADAWIEQPISNCRVLQVCSIWFSGEHCDGYAVDFKVEIFSGSSVLWSSAVTYNINSTCVVFGGFTVYNPTAIRFTPTRWSLPKCRLRCIEIVPGIYERWTGDNFTGIDWVDECDPSCLTLPYGSGAIGVNNMDRRFEPRNKDGVFSSLTDRQGQWLEVGPQLPGGHIEYKPIGFLYLFGDSWHTGDNAINIQWRVTSIIGLLAHRKYNPPAVLPTTFSGWLESVTSQLGENFKNRYSVANNLGTTPMICNASDVANVVVGDLLRWICMAAGAIVGYPVYPRMDPSTGYLLADVIRDNICQAITVDNLSSYPSMAARGDIASLFFRVGDAEYVFAGTKTSAERTENIENPFITSRTLAARAAGNILRFFGGNVYQLVGRGNPAGELGDVDSISLDKMQDVSARRIRQQLRIQDGVMAEVISELIDGNAAISYDVVLVLEEAGFFIVPSGVVSAYIIAVGGGDGGFPGGNGNDGEDGAPGAGGDGGRIFASTIPVSPGSEIFYSAGTGGRANGGTGDASTFGAYSSANGAIFATGLAVLQTGRVYGYSGIDGIVRSIPAQGAAGLAGTGAGGRGGSGGSKAVWGQSPDGLSELLAVASKGGGGGEGGSGVIIACYNLP